ncbi:Ger(x)C family spore germination protein [Cohnella panacarvi]|uniref:Ger(x)C family spore germination protein n=1 Tax=Cohnella panacarvi TaxID=400776 RepID=UPI00047DCD46|nr:Ger(x)C family spore germination protein [Cohnella panacarvi]
MHQTTLRSEQGIDIADALSKLQMKLPRKFFWGQCKIFLFGEEIAKDGILEYMDFLLRHPQPRETGYVMIAKGEAAKMLELFPPIEISSSEVLQELSKMKHGLNVTLEEYSIMLKGESPATALPFAHILPPPKSAKKNDTIAYLSGTAILKRGKLAGELSPVLTRGVLWIRNEIEEYTITFKERQQSGNVALKPIHASVRLIPHIDGEDWTMIVKVRTNGDMVANGTNLNPMIPTIARQIETVFAEDVKARIEETIEEVQRKQKADILGFAAAFHRKYPKQWAKVKGHWDKAFAEVRVKVEVDAIIRRSGLLSWPDGMSKEKAELN